MSSPLSGSLFSSCFPSVLSPALALSLALILESAGCSSGGQPRGMDSDAAASSMQQDGGARSDLSGRPDLFGGPPGAPTPALPVWADTVRSAADLPGVGSVNIGYAADGSLIGALSTNTDSIVLSTGKPEELSLPGRFQSALAYYTPAGRLLRARYTAEPWTAAQPGFTQSRALINVLPSGAVQILGAFAGAGRFGAGDPGERQLQTQRVEKGGTIYVVQDPFVATFNPQGAIDWIGRGTQTVGISQPMAYVYGITGHQDGSITSTGIFEDNMDFSGADGSHVAVPHVHAYNPAMFVARHKKAGQIDWVRRVYDAWPSSVSGKSDGGFLVAGAVQTSSGVTFGEGEPGESKLPPPAMGTHQQFAASYAADGKLRWARAIQGTQVRLSVTALGASGGYLVVGSASGEVTFPATPGAPATITADPDTDALLLRYEEDGSLRWARTLGGPGYQDATAITSSGDGFYLALSIGDKGASIQTAKGVRIAPPAAASGGTLLLQLTADGGVSEVYALGDGITTLSLALSLRGELAAGGQFGTAEHVAAGALLGAGSANPITLAPAPSGARNVFFATFKL